MANIKIAPVLKKCRKQNDLSVHEVSKKLKERSLNVAEKNYLRMGKRTGATQC